jgi:hypothetical protein
LALASRIARRTALALWEARFSMMTMSPGMRVASRSR